MAQHSEDWPKGLLRLMRALHQVVDDYYGTDSQEIYELDTLYRGDGPGSVVATACGIVIHDQIPLPTEVVRLYKIVGETELDDDPMFMDDYYEDLVRLAA